MIHINFPMVGTGEMVQGLKTCFLQEQGPHLNPQYPLKCCAGLISGVSWPARLAVGNAEFTERPWLKIQVESCQVVAWHQPLASMCVCTHFHACAHIHLQTHTYVHTTQYYLF